MSDMERLIAAIREAAAKNLRESGERCAKWMNKIIQAMGGNGLLAHIPNALEKGVIACRSNEGDGTLVFFDVGLADQYGKLSDGSRLFMTSFLMMDAELAAARDPRAAGDMLMARVSRAVEELTSFIETRKGQARQVGLHEQLKDDPVMR